MSVDFVMLRDSQNQFMFSPLQSEYALKNLPPEMTKQLSTLVLQEESKLYTKSDAVIRIGELLGGFWGLSRFLRILPRALRNTAYDFIANHRYQWFGQKETCRLPTPEERQKFLL